MKYHEFIDEFRKQVANISYERQLNLAISVCSKLFPDYESFCEINNFGNPQILQKAITLLKNSEFISENEIKKNISEIEQNTPDAEDYMDCSYALNACISIIHSLHFILDKDPDRVFAVGTCLTDTIDFRIQENQDLTEEEIDKQPFMIEARDFLLKATSN